MTRIMVISELCWMVLATCLGHVLWSFIWDPSVSPTAGGDDTVA